MEKLYPFTSVGQALHWFNWHNPSRQKYVNIFELERGQKPGASHFSGSHPHDIWASICAAISTVLHDFDARSTLMFNLSYRGDRTRQKAAEELAEHFGISPRHVNRLISRVLDDLESELIRRGLVEPVHRYFHPSTTKGD